MAGRGRGPSADPWVVLSAVQVMGTNAATRTLVGTAVTTRRQPRKPGGGSAGKTRDEFIFVLRGVSMLLVVLTHMTFGVVSGDGTSLQPLGGGPGWDIASWFIAWLALFFFVGGALSRRLVNVRYWDFLKRRGVRLLAPYYVFAAVMLPIEVVLWRFVPSSPCGGYSLQKAVTWILPLHEDCLRLAQGPMWFLAVFIPIALAAPLLVRVWDSRLRWIAPSAALAFLVVFDILLITTDLTHSSVLGADEFRTSTTVLFLMHVYLFWTLVFYLGFTYADGYVQRLGRALVPLGVGCVTLLVAMVGVGPYPGGVFGLWWAGGNQFPPTLAWFVATLAALFLFTAARDRIGAWGQRPLVHPVLAWFGERSLTILLWHMIAYTILYWSVRLLGLLPTVEALPLPVERLFWFTFGLALTVPIVNLFYPVEKWTLETFKDFPQRLLGTKPRATRTTPVDETSLPDTASMS